LFFTKQSAPLLHIMKTVKLILFTFIIFWGSMVYGQENLVPNPSFEFYTQPPNAISQLYLADPWIGFATDAGMVPADYYHRDALSDIALVPNNYLGHQYPLTGNGYAGFIVFSNDYPYYREFIQVKLTEPLITDSSYYAEMHVSLAENRTLGIGNLGMLFTVNNPFYYLHGYEYLESLKNKKRTRLKKEQFTKNIPQVGNEPERIIYDDQQWIKISGVFTANGGEKVLTIGNFSKRKHTNSREVRYQHTGFNVHNDAYYFVDDIKVVSVYHKATTVELSKMGAEELSYDQTYFKELAVYKPISLNHVYFKSDDFNIQPESFFELNQLYDLLVKNERIKILIEGHTDDTNTQDYNLTLSSQRATAVKKYLVQRGIANNRIETIGYGESKPIADNDTEFGKRKNRRVVFRIKSSPALAE